MVKLFIGLGVLIFVGGCVAVGLALPYVVLERGFTQVIVGTVAMNAGLVLIGIGALLREIRKGRLANAGAALPDAALTAVEAAEAKSNSIAPLATAAAAGAVAASVALAASTSAEAAADKTSQSEFDWPKLDLPTPVPEPTLDLPKFELPPLDVPKLDWARRDLPDVGDLPDADDLPMPDAVSNLGDMPGQDEFTRLRAALSDQLERPDRSGPSNEDRGAPEAASALQAPEEHEPAQSDAGPDMAPQVDASAQDAPQVQRGAPQVDDLVEDQAEDDTSPAAMADAEEEPEPEAVSEASMVDAPQPAAATVSNEGIMRAYQVGDTAFTVYGDGTIRAETSEGEYTFQSMEEVRAFLTQEKLKVRS